MKKINWKTPFQLELGSVLLIIFGGILLLNPDFGSAAVSAILGWVLIGAGVFGLLVAVLTRLGFGTMAGSLVLLGAGIYLVRNPLMLASLLGFLLGVLMASQGLGALRDALRLKRCGGVYQLRLIFAAGMVLLGLMLIFSPLTTSRFVMSIAGIVMIACGIGNLFSHRTADKYITHHDSPVIDADE